MRLIAKSFLLAGLLLALLAAACGPAAPAAGPTSGLAETPAPVAPSAKAARPAPVAHPDWPRYTSEAFLVSFAVPPGWQPLPDAEERYGGPDGFVQLSGAGGESLALICDSEAHHKLLPYGSQPTVERGAVQGQPACWIWPSADQPLDMKGWAALIVTLPQPVQVNQGTYGYLVMWGDEAHLRDVGGSLGLTPMGQ